MRFCLEEDRNCVMASINKIISCKIANASVFAMMMIVGIHVLGHGWQSLEKGSAIWWLTAFGQYGIFSVAVPFFFACSGYFLAGHMDEDGWWCRECKKRLWTLLIPYIIWCMIFVLLSIGLDAWKTDGMASSWTSLTFWIDAFGLSPFRHPSLGPLWYVRALIMFVIISPAVLFAIRKMGWLPLLVVYVLAGVTHPIGRVWEVGALFLIYCFSFSGFFFFCVGIYGRLKHIEFPKRGHISALVIGLSLVFINAYCNMRGIKFSFPQSGLVIPILLFGFWGIIPEKKLPACLTNSTFGIFLLHIPLYEIWRVGLSMKVESVSQYITKWGIGYGGSLILTLAIRRYCPNIARLLFGGRV